MAVELFDKRARSDAVRGRRVGRVTGRRRWCAGRSLLTAAASVGTDHRPFSRFVAAAPCGLIAVHIIAARGELSTEESDLLRVSAPAANDGPPCARRRGGERGQDELRRSSSRSRTRTRIGSFCSVYTVNGSYTGPNARIVCQCVCLRAFPIRPCWYVGDLKVKYDK